MAITTANPKIKPKKLFWLVCILFPYLTSLHRKVALKRKLTLVPLQTHAAVDALLVRARTAGHRVSLTTLHAHQNIQLQGVELTPDLGQTHRKAQRLEPGPPVEDRTDDRSCLLVRKQCSTFHNCPYCSSSSGDNSSLLCATIARIPSQRAAATTLASSTSTHLWAGKLR